jgi:fermentation-respiration switch protein FrsA (DUF1100 family)
MSISSHPTNTKRGWRYWLKLIGVFIVVLYTARIAVRLLITLPLAAHPFRNVACCDTPATVGLDYEEVEFTSDDGLTLQGWYVPSENHANVILAHGIHADRSQMLPHARMLAQKGYGVLLFDLRAHGKSDGDTLIYSGDDVLAALNYLRGRDDVDPDRIGALGFSLGAGLVIQAAAEDEGIRAVVADEPGAIGFADSTPFSSVSETLAVSFNLLFFPLLPTYTHAPNPPPAVEQIQMVAPRPVLIIAQQDNVYPATTARKVFEAAQEPKELWVFSGSGHGAGPVLFPEEYAREITEFFDRALLSQ